MEITRLPATRVTAEARDCSPTGEANDGGTGAGWPDDESRPSHTKITGGGLGVVQGEALDSEVVGIIGGQAGDGAGGRGGEVESVGGVGGTVPVSGGLITGVEGGDAGEAILELHPGAVGMTGPGPRERDKGASRQGGEVSGVVSSGTGVPLQQAVAKEELYDALKCVPPHVQLYMQDARGTLHDRIVEMLRMEVPITVANCREVGFTEDDLREVGFTGEDLASAKFIVETQTFESDPVRYTWSKVAQQVAADDEGVGGRLSGLEEKKNKQR